MAKLTQSGRGFESFLDDLELVESNGESMATDVFEENGNVIVEAHISGLDPEHIDISVEGNELFIEGFREEIFEEEDRDYYMQEISYGAFERIVPLPAEVNLDQAEAEYDNGVLSITLPKRDIASRQKIDVKSDSKSRAKKSASKSSSSNGRKKSASSAKSTKSNGKKADASKSKSANSNSAKLVSKSANSSNERKSQADTKSTKSNGRKSASSNGNNGSKLASKSNSSAKSKNASASNGRRKASKSSK